MSHNDSVEEDNKETSIEEKLLKVEELKKDGNNEISKQNYNVAYEKYTEGAELLNQINDANNETYNALYKQICSNLSLAALKTNRYSVAIKNATEVLKTDSNNTKILYRRAYCYLENKDYDDAEADIENLRRLNFKFADDLLKTCKQRKKRYDMETKKHYQAFFKNNEGLYNDKEREREELLMKEKEQKDQAHQEFIEKQKKGEIAQDIDFDNYYKEFKEKEKENLEKKQKEEYESKKKVSLLGSKIHTDELELDEEDKKILEETRKKGYCYFKNDAKNSDNDMTKKLNAPIKLNTQDVSSSQSTTSRGVSDWNKAGATYEEKDTSNWCKTMLQSYLANIGNKDYKLANIVIDGDAQIMVIRGELRRFYDFNIVFDVQSTTENNTIETISIEDVTYENKKVSIDKLVLKKANKSGTSLPQNVLIQLKEQLYSALLDFENIYNTKI